MPAARGHHRSARQFHSGTGETLPPSVLGGHMFDVIFARHGFRVSVETLEQAAQAIEMFQDSAGPAKIVQWEDERLAEFRAAIAAGF